MPSDPPDPAWPSLDAEDRAGPSSAQADGVPGTRFSAGDTRPRRGRAEAGPAPSGAGGRAAADPCRPGSTRAAAAVRANGARASLAVAALLFTTATAHGDGSSPPAATTPADAEDAYAIASQSLRQADAAVVRARQQAVTAYRSTPAYVAAAAAVDATFEPYADKRNALLTAAEQHDPRYAPLKRGAADADAELARDAQGPTAVPPEQFGVLLNERAGFLKQLTALEEDVIDRDPDAKRLRQQWTDACGKLRGLQDRQGEAVEGTPAVRSAEAAAATARADVARARAVLPAPATTEPAEPMADEFVRRFPRYGIGWNDAWLTFGSPPVPAAAR